MKKVRTIKISVTTREILVAHSETGEMSAETELRLCPACHSRIAEAVGSVVAALPETEHELTQTIEINKEINQ